VKRLLPTTVKRFARRAWRRADPVIDLVDPGRRRCFPRDFDVIEGYRERFPDTARAFVPFLKQARAIDPPPGPTPVAVVVMPWFGTPCPWYSVALGLGLARRGIPITFVWHDPPFPEPSSYVDLQNDEIGRVMRELGRRFPVLRVSDQAEDRSADAGDAELVERLTDANLTWRLRGADPEERDVALGRRMHRHLADALARVRPLVRDHAFRYAVVPGGVLGPSGLYLAAGRAAGVRVATFDAGLGWNAIDTDGVAAQLTDLPRAFALLADEPDGGGAAVAAAREEFDKRRSGRDQHRYQSTAPAGRAAGASTDILIPLSVIFDTAALGRHHLFPDSQTWLIETIEVLLRETRDPIIVRQHPSERHALERSRFDVRAILSHAFGSNPQVRFVAADDPASTYDLVDAARLVLPFVSTIGIEAAALGKPVIVSGAVYYAGMGFVWAPSRRDEYLETVGRGARGDLALLPDQVDRAWRCFYLSAVCNRVWTDFTAQPPDYWRWVRRRPDELYDDPDVADTLTAIDQNVPLAIVRHRRQRSAPAREAARSGAGERG
jgi:Capsule polysaccharide biosynthesis protein